MSINCAVILRWDSTPTQQRALGAALWSWCRRATGSAGIYPFLDNQALADLLAGNLPASGARTGDAGLPRVAFSIPGDPARDAAATLESLRRALPGEGVAEIRVEYADKEMGKQGDGQTRRRANKEEEPETSFSLSPCLSLTPSPSEDVQLSPGMWLVNLVAVVTPFAGLVAAALFLWGGAFHWVDLGLLLGMYALTSLGITVGFHRLFTHRAFETNRGIQFVLAVLGSMAAEGSLLKWVALHRRHHQHSDQPGDPHSPQLRGRGFLGFLSGFWHAHVGWVFQADPPNLSHYVKDLSQSRLLRTASALFPLWVALGLLIPAALGGVLTATWKGVLLGMMWGGLARIFLVHHVTWSVNSICHLWGRRPFRTNDSSRNNFLFGVLALGEGWHNNHHAFPTSTRHGLRWWQIDVSYWVIRFLALLGLAWKIVLPARKLLNDAMKAWPRRDRSRAISR
jgi:stearoyl-CoA desaturase (delta-9 desaturase)